MIFASFEILFSFNFELQRFFLDTVFLYYTTLILIINASTVFYFTYSLTSEPMETYLKKKENKFIKEQGLHILVDLREI
jgi:hypothetical protein